MSATQDDDFQRVYLFGGAGRVKHTLLFFLFLLVVLIALTTSPLELSLLKVYYQSTHVLRRWDSADCQVVAVSTDDVASVVYHNAELDFDYVAKVQNIYKFTGADLELLTTYTCLYDPDPDDADTGGDNEDEDDEQEVLIEDWVIQARNGYVIAFFFLPWLFLIIPVILCVLLAIVSLKVPRPEGSLEVERALQPYCFQFLPFGRKMYELAWSILQKQKGGDSMTLMPLTVGDAATSVAPIDDLEKLAVYSPLVESAVLGYLVQRPNPEVYLMEDKGRGLAGERVLQVYSLSGLFGWGAVGLACLLVLPVAIVATISCVATLIYYLPSVSVIATFYAFHYILYPFILLFVLLLDYILARKYSYLVETSHRDIHFHAGIAFGDPFYYVAETASINMKGVPESAVDERAQHSGVQLGFSSDDDAQPESDEEMMTEL